MLPKELFVVVNDLSANMPTHMLVVYSHQVPAATKRQVMLLVMHNIILASHCVNLPILQSSASAMPKLAGESISIPVDPLCIPVPEVFPLPLHQAHQPSSCNPAASASTCGPLH